MVARKQRRREENKGLNIPIKRHSPDDLTPSYYIPTVKVSFHHLLGASSKAARLHTRFLLQHIPKGRAVGFTAS